MDSATATAGGAIAILIFLGILVAVLWILLPFAVFGIKPLMRQILSEQRDINRQLADLARERGKD